MPGGRAAPLSMPWLRSTPAYAAISSAWTGLSRGDVAGCGDEDAVRVDRRPGGHLDAAAEPVDRGPQRPFVGDRPEPT